MSDPRRIGKYEILEELGRGGFAVVYQARDPSLDRMVAVKVLRTHVADNAEFVERFQREARTAASFHHSHIVTIYEVGEEAGQHYIAMQYLSGKGLKKLLEEADGPLPLEQVAAIIAQIADALDYIHRWGAVHRDVKPSNIIVSETGNATLLDFGIVRAADDTQLTATGDLMGTPRYISPEQAKITGKVDARSDIYALGVVAYEMLTGRAPFVGETPTVLHAHAYEPPPDPRPLNPILDEDLTNVLLKALAKDPDQRYQSAGAFAEALRSETDRLEEKQKHIKRLLDQAEDAMADEQWDDAISNCEEILHLNSEHPQAKETLAQARQKLEQTQQVRAEAIGRQRFPKWGWATLIVIILAILLGGIYYSFSQPDLTIKSHRNDDFVERTAVITGTYRNLNPTQNLWAIVQSESGDYYVNDHFPVEARQGTWAMATSFGYEGTRSIGHIYKVFLMAVEEGSDAEKFLDNARGPLSELPTERVQLMNKAGLTLVRTSPDDCWLADFWSNEAWSGNPQETRSITSTFLFQEWWQPPVDGMPESGWTARFVRRLNFSEDGEYCFYRVSDEDASVSIDNVPLEMSHNENNWKEPVSGCREFTAGEHNIRVDLANLQDDGQSVIELWYEGPGVQPPKGATSGDWQAWFFPTPNLTGDPLWLTSLSGPNLRFNAATKDEIPVVNFGAIFSRTFTLTETGYYRFNLDVDDGARFEICGNEVLDEFHWGPATYTVERYLEAGDHTLRLDYYESHEDQHMALEWHKITAPTPPIQRILFASDRDGDYDIYVMDANGANPVNLTDNTAGDGDPAWSPDGQQIVFASNRDGTWQLYVMDADGSDVHALGVTGFQPRWSPDGSRIVFMEGSEGSWEIYVVDADGTNIVQLTDNEVADFTPSWSPDGSRILFETGRDAPDRQQEIYVMNADGSEPANLSQHPAWDGTPAWSPDGETIAFFSDRDGNNEIYLMNADGSNQRRLTSSEELKDEFPTWSPDGRFLAFQGSNQIYRNDVDGADLHMALTDHPAEHDRPYWSPPGYGYVFENLTNGDDVHEHALVVAGDYVWTGGDGGLTRWNREEPERQKKFTSEDGLAENSIHALLAENASSLWVGTGGWPFSGSGLSHYDFRDGRDHWRTFTAGDGLGSNTVFDLYQDSQGKIWAGTTNGVRIYEGARWRGFAEMEDIWVRSLFEASDGSFWFGTSGDGVVRYDPAASDEGAWQWFNPMVLSQADDVGYRYVLDIIESPPGELWFATHGGVVYHDFAGSGAWQILSGTLDVWTYAAERDQDGALWFGTDRGVVRRDAEGEHTYTVGDGIIDDVRALHLDDAGVLWAAGNGLYRYDREHDQWQDFYTRDDLVYNHVSAILEDREGAFWLAHSIFKDYASFDGVTRHTPANGDWQHFDSENGWGNDSDGVHAILQDRDGILWFGFDRDGGGVCRYDLDEDEWLPCYRADANGLVTDTVDAIAETPDGALWFGTSGGGLSRFDNERWETFTEHNSDLLSDEIHCLATDNEGSLWITTDQGVNRFFYETGEWVPFTIGNSDLIADEVLSLALDDSDGVWFGTQAGLSHYNLKDRKWQNFEGTPALASWVNNCSQTLHVDRYGSVWVGTDEGLYRSTPEGGWVHLTTANGLASNHVLAIFEDSEGTLWIGTSSGISSVTLEK